MKYSRYKITKEFIEETTAYRPLDTVTEVMNFSNPTEAIDWQYRVNKAAESGKVNFRVVEMRFLEKVSDDLFFVKEKAK